MGIGDLTSKKLENIFNERHLETKKNEWKKVRHEFMDIGMENLLKEDMHTLTFHIFYTKMVEMSDGDIFDHIIEEL